MLSLSSFTNFPHFSLHSPTHSHSPTVRTMMTHQQTFQSFTSFSFKCTHSCYSFNFPHATIPVRTMITHHEKLRRDKHVAQQKKLYPKSKLTLTASDYGTQELLVHGVRVPENLQHYFVSHPESWETKCEKKNRVKFERLQRSNAFKKEKERKTGIKSGPSWRKAPGQARTLRQIQVGERIKKALTYVLRESPKAIDFFPFLVGKIAIVDVHPSANLRDARIFLQSSPLQEQISQNLSVHAKKIRYLLAQCLDIKRVPNLTFSFISNKSP